MNWKFIPDEQAPENIRELAADIYSGIDGLGGDGYEAGEVLSATMRAVLDVITKVADVTEERESSLLQAASDYFSSQAKICRAFEEHPETAMTQH
jgi:hypothetical protein